MIHPSKALAEKLSLVQMTSQEEKLQEEIKKLNLEIF